MSDTTISTKSIVSADMLDTLCRDVQQHPSEFVTLRLADGSEAALVDKGYLCQLVETVVRMEQSRIDQLSGVAGAENFYLEVSPQTVDDLFGALESAMKTVKDSTLDLLNSTQRAIQENVTDPLIKLTQPDDPKPDQEADTDG